MGRTHGPQTTDHGLYLPAVYLLDVASLLDDGAIVPPDFSPSAVEMVGSVTEGIVARHIPICVIEGA